jgi:hypothetical protein
MIPHRDTKTAYLDRKLHEQREVVLRKSTTAWFKEKLK